MVKVGLIGAGRIGRVHAAAISQHSGSGLAGVADVIEENAQALAADFNSTCMSVDQILSDSNINAVLIASSTDTHCDLIEQATAAGKAVLCEKPVDLSLDRAKACLERVTPTGVPVMMGFNRRFDPNFAAVQSAVAAGEIGKAELLSITSLDPSPPPIEYVRVSGGLFRDMMIHDFDMAHFMMGGLPETITAVGSCLVDPAIGQEGDVDTAVATLSYNDGRIAVIKNSRRAAYGYDQRLELLGSEGMLRVENVNESTVVKANADGITAAKPMHFFLERYMPAYAIEWAAFVEVVENKAEIPATLHDGVAALAMAEAATLSAKSAAPLSVQNLL